MITNDQNLGTPDESQNYGTGSTSFGMPDNGDTTNRDSSEDVSDDDLDTEDDDLSSDDSDDADSDYDTDDELSTDTEDTESGNGVYTTGTSDNAYGNNTGGYGNSGNDPDEIPEQGQSANEGMGYGSQTEVAQQQDGNDASYSEQNDVTPPNQHEFPSEGTANKTDFTSRDQGRTTGRMVGHEPGTEGI